MSCGLNDGKTANSLQTPHTLEIGVRWAGLVSRLSRRARASISFYLILSYLSVAGVCTDMIGS